MEECLGHAVVLLEAVAEVGPMARSPGKDSGDGNKLDCCNQTLLGGEEGVDVEAKA